MLQIIEKVGKTSAICICSVCAARYQVKNRYDANKSPVGDLCVDCKTAVCDMGEITQSKLQAVFNYSPNTGELTYRNTSLSGKSGELAVITHSGGYFTTRINGIDYLTHRVIHMYMTGKWPNVNDHINHNRQDNRWGNLRNVDNKINLLNTSLSKNSATKVNGVALHKPTNKYRAYVMVDRKQVHLGLFTTIEEAAAARAQADLKYGFHKNHGK